MFKCKVKTLFRKFLLRPYLLAHGLTCLVIHTGGIHTDGIHTGGQLHFYPTVTLMATPTRLIVCCRKSVYD